MTTFKYSFISRFIYRYSNFIATFLLVFHALVSFSALWLDWVNVFPLLINLLIIYLLNRFFFRVYKYFPFRIEADNEKLICSNFFFRDRKVEILLSDIDKIEGGIFSNKPSAPIYLFDGKNKVKIGMLQHMTDFNKLLTIILSNINEKLYKKIMKDIRNNQQVPKRKK